jgi:hypothetical protein
MRPDGDHDGRVARGYLFILLAACGARVRDTWQLWSCLEPEGGCRSHGARGGLGATPSREAGAEGAGTRGCLGAAPSREAGAVVLT